MVRGSRDKERIHLASLLRGAYIMTMDTPTPAKPVETAPESRALEEEERLLEAAEAEADRIGTIPAAEVRAWVESWGTANELPPPEPRK